MGLPIKKLIIIICSTLFIIGAINFFYTPEINIKADSTFIYDKFDNLVYTIGPNISEKTRYEDISKHLIDALVSTEDKSFFIHSGIDFKRIIKSLYTNIKNKKIKEGASTITQQLAKNLFLNNDKKLSRKLKEIMISYKLEKKYSKKEILELYLNNILFGGRLYGIKSASLSYFNKLPSELDILESSYLAAIIQMPNYYLKNLDKLHKRKNIVLKNMHDNLYISDFEYLKYKDIYLDIKQTIYNSCDYYFYIDYLIDELFNLGINPYISSHKIYTNLDSRILKNIKKIFDNINSDFNSSICVINKLGEIEAIYCNTENGINYAKTPLQPGSTIKPILDYAPSFEYFNLTPGSVILDDEISYSNGEKIKNFDNSYKGLITIREALRTSRNIPALKLFKNLGDKAFSFSNKLGINLNEDYCEAMSIGGFKYGYSLINLTNAYLGFQTLGNYKVASTIRKIDNTIYNNEFKKAMKTETAYFINDILHDVIKNSNYNIKDNYMCAKTGQTNFDKSTKLKYNIPNYGVKDSLYIGYNPEILIGVWSGYDNFNNYLTPITKDTPRIIFKNVMELYNLKTKPYQMPDSLVKCRYFYDGDYYFDDEFNISYKSNYDLFYKTNLPKDKWLNY